MGRNLLFIILCIAIVFVGIDVFKPIDKKETVGISKEKVKIQKPLVEYEEEPEEVVASEKPILIYFYTTWCGGCKKFSPYWDKLTREYSDKFTCLKINIEEPKYKKLARGFNIRSIPQVYIYDRANNRKIKLRASTYMNPQLDEYYKKYYEK